MITASQPNHSREELPAYVSGALDAERAETVASHLARCSTCRAEEAEWRAVALGTQTAFAGGSAARGLLDRVWLQIDGDARASHRPPARGGRRLLPRSLGARLWTHPRGLAAGITAAACFLLGAFAGARADNLFDIFKPQQFAAVPVSLQDLQNLPDLSNYGTLTSNTAPLSQITTYDTPEAAAAAAGIAVHTPDSLPAGVSVAPAYTTVPGASASFTFSAAKAEAAAAAHGKSLPPMPAGLDGATLQLVTAPVVLAIYGGPSAAGSSQPASNDGFASVPVLAIGQTTAPKVVASGASASDIEHYLLSQPGISPQLAGAIRALGTPGDTWPIPIPVNAARSHPVQVQGVKGLAIGDSTGLGAGILWQKDGIVYAVAGTLSEQELLSVANSLH